MNGGSVYKDVVIAYEFDDGLLIDSSRNKLDGSMQGSVDRAEPGLVGTHSGLFTVDQNLNELGYIIVPHDPAQNFSDEFMISLRVRLANVGRWTHVFLSKSDTSSNAPSSSYYVAYFEDPDNGKSEWRFFAGGTLVRLENNPPLEPAYGHEHFVNAWIKDGIAYLEIDGLVQRSKALSSPIDQTDEELIIGGLSYGVQVQTNGELDSVFLFSSSFDANFRAFLRTTGAMYSSLKKYHSKTIY